MAVGAYVSMVVETLRNPTRRMKHQVFVFVLTFLVYAFFHATRKAFSNLKSTIGPTDDPSPNHPHDQLNPPMTRVFLAVLDTIFLAAYAVGLFVNGRIGDMFNVRYVLLIGMCGSAICVSMFGWAKFWDVRAPAFFAVFWCLNGLFQSTGWPATVSVMGNWFSKRSRGVVMGVWSANASAGNMVGSLMVTAVLSYGWPYGFFLPSGVLFLFGWIVFFFLVPHPEDAGFLPAVEEIDDIHSSVVPADGEGGEHSKDTERLLTQSAADFDEDDEPPPSERRRSSGSTFEPISFMAALRVPGVVLYSLSYACIKSANYFFFFWLPYYLTDAASFSPQKANLLSNIYDVGGIVGGVVAGLLSDVAGKRSFVMFPMLLLSPITLYVYRNFGDDYTVNGLLMFIMGFFINGAANQISSTVSADLGRQGALRSNKEALATVSGIVDGTGSIGAAIMQGIVALAMKKPGADSWDLIFYILMGVMLLSALLLSGLFVNDVRHARAAVRRDVAGVQAPAMAAKDE